MESSSSRGPPPSSAYPSSRRVSTRNLDIPSSRRDERTANGPLTAERAQIDQIRSMLEKTQRRLAREHAHSTSQHGYNSSSGASMMSVGGNMVVSSTSTRYHSTSRHHTTHSTRTVTTVNATSSGYVGSSHYFPPDYTSQRAPAVQSVYLEDLSTVVVSEQRDAPTSRAPTSYAPGGGPPQSTAGGGLYAPVVHEARSSRRVATSSSHHHHSQYDSRSTSHHHHHHHHHQQPPPSSRHHHHHRHTSTTTTSSSRPPSSTHPHKPRFQYLDQSDSDESPTRQPPPSSKGILKHSSSIPQPPPSSTTSFMSPNFVEYSTHHDSVPLSFRGHQRDLPAPPPSSTRQRLDANGQPERSALKRGESSSSGSGGEFTDDDVPPAPQSRVRFEDELVLMHNQPQSIMYSPLVEEDEYNTDDDDEAHLSLHREFTPSDHLEPVVAIKAPPAPADQHVEEKPMPPSPKRATPTRLSDAEPMEPRGRRGSSSARTPPNLSPSGSHARKSLSTVDPPTSAIDFSLIDHFDFGTRRASRENARVSTTEVDVDAMSVSSHELSPVKEPLPEPRERRSSLTDRTRGLMTLSSSPIAVHSPRGFSRSSLSRPSHAEADSDDDDVPTLPPMDLVPSDIHRSTTTTTGPRQNDEHEQDQDELVVKASPSSSSGDYSDARAFGEDEEVDDNAAVIMEVKSLTETTPVVVEEPEPEPKVPSASKPHSHSEYKNFWEGPSDSEEEEDVVGALPPPTLGPEDELMPLIYSNTNAMDSGPQDDVVPFIVREEEHKSVDIVDDELPVIHEEKPAPRRVSTTEVDIDAMILERQEVEVNRRIQHASDLNTPPQSPPLPANSHSPESPPPLAASAVAATLSPHPRKPMMPLSQSMMMMAPPSTTTPRRNMPPPRSTYISPSPATTRPTVTRPGSSTQSQSAVARAPATLDGSTYVPRRLRSKQPLGTPGSQARALAMPPSIGALSGLASGPVTFEMNEQAFYEVVWQTGEFGFSFQRVYLADDRDSRQMFLRMLLNTERGTCPSFKQVHAGDVLIQIGDTLVSELNLDRHGGGSAMTKFFMDLRAKTPLRLVFQRTDPMSWEGGVEL